MAKNDRSSIDQAHVKIRFLEFEIDGSNASISESVRSIAATLGRGVVIRESMQRAEPSEKNGQVPISTSETEERYEPRDLITEEVGGLSRPAPRRRTGKAKPASLSVVPVDFAKAELSLADFVAGVELGSMTRKFTIVAAWFKQYLQVDAIDANQMLTAYKHIGWTDMPNKPQSVFHDLVNKDSYKWFAGGAEKGSYAINFIGEQKVAEWRKGK